MKRSIYDYFNANNALDIEMKVKRLLLHVPYLLSKRYYEGEYEASDLILDLQTAIQIATLSTPQKRMLYLLYFEGKTQEQVGDMLGVHQHTISSNTKTAIRKLAKVYERWSIIERREDHAAIKS